MSGLGANRLKQSASRLDFQKLYLYTLRLWDDARACVCMCVFVCVCCVCVCVCACLCVSCDAENKFQF